MNKRQLKKAHPFLAVPLRTPEEPLQGWDGPAASTKNVASGLAGDRFRCALCGGDLLDYTTTTAKGDPRFCPWCGKEVLPEYLLKKEATR